MQATMSIFLKREITSQEEPRVGPSGGSPEGIIITREDSSMCVIAFEDLLVGQNVDLEDTDVDDPDPA